MTKCTVCKEEITRGTYCRKCRDYIKEVALRRGREIRLAALDKKKKEDTEKILDAIHIGRTAAHVSNLTGLPIKTVSRILRELRKEKKAIIVFRTMKCLNGKKFTSYWMRK